MRSALLRGSVVIAHPLAHCGKARFEPRLHLLWIARTRRRWRNAYPAHSCAVRGKQRQAHPRLHLFLFEGAVLHVAGGW